MISQQRSAIWISAVLLSVCLAGWPASSTAQEQDPLPAQAAEWSLQAATMELPLPVAVSAPQLQTAPVAVQRRVLLPITRTAPRVTHLFGSTDANADGVPDNPGTSLANGVTRLYYHVRIEGASGQRYRVEWTINGARVPALDDTGTVSSRNFVTYGYIFLTSGNPLPQGNYLVRTYLASTLYRETTVSIR